MQPDLVISYGAVKLTASFISYILNKIKEEAEKTDSNGLGLREIHAVVKKVFPKQLAKQAHQHGLKAYLSDAKKKVGGDRAKKQKVTGNPKEVDPKLILSIRNLKKIQDDLVKINDEALYKVDEIEQKYRKIMKPVYDKRNEIIKSIPDFWLNAFLSHPTLGKLMNEEDQKIFKYLSSLNFGADIKSDDECSTINLYFNPNPYFEDSELSENFTFLEDGTLMVSDTPIRWKEGKGIPNGIDHEKKGNERAPVDVSFLSRFCDCELKDDMIAVHYKVAEVFTKPLNYFKNGLFKRKRKRNCNGQEEPDDEEKDEEGIEEKGDDEEGN